MYTVYAIKSKIRNWTYIGFSQNPERRLQYHNSGRVRSTKTYRPFEIIYSKKFNTRLEARKYEKFLKVGSNKEKLVLNGRPTA